MATRDQVTLSTQLVGRRLILRAPRPTDIPELRALVRDNAEHLRPWSPASPLGQSTPTLTELSRSIARYHREWKEGSAYVFVITLREPGAPIVGRIALTSVVRGPFQNAHLGYWTAANYQGRGIATEATELVIDFAFGTLELHRLEAAVMPQNLASRRILAKAAFREEGLAQRYLSIAGKWEDHILFALTREEWEGRRSKPSL